MRVERGLCIVDVRTEEELLGGKIPTAIHLPLGTLSEGARAALPNKDQAILVYCATGIRSARALELLSRLGYWNVQHLEGGIARWQQMGYPMVSPQTNATMACAADLQGRYSRQLSLKEVGASGQERLAHSRVLLVGLGGLGAPVALYLAGAGVGTLGLVDADTVSVSNLHRQIIHSMGFLESPKVESARSRLAELNPDVNVEVFPCKFDPSTANEILAQRWDVIVDGGDNFDLRYLLNEKAVERRIALCHGSVDRFEGRVTTFLANSGPCYCCLFPEPPTPGIIGSCVERGVLGVLPGVIGTLQATEVIKLLLGIGTPLSGRLLTYDALLLEFRTLCYRKNLNCRVCSNRP